MRVLRLISKRLCTGLAGGAVYLVNNLIGDEGGRALGAALQVKPAPMQVKPAPGLADRWVGDAQGVNPAVNLCGNGVGVKPASTYVAMG